MEINKITCESKKGNYSSISERVRKGWGVTLESGTTGQRNISAADMVRFEENEKMADVVYSEFIDLLEGRLSLEDALKKMKNPNMLLTSSQQNVMQRIATLIERGGRSSIDSMPEDANDKLKTFYEKSGRLDGARTLFRRGMSKEMEDRIPEDCIEILSWGTVVVSIKDFETWKKIVGDQISAGTILGHKKQWRSGGQVKYGEKDRDIINRQFERTVYLYDKQDLPNDLKRGIRQHEIFHDIYENFIEPLQSVIYKEITQKRIFSDFKDEIVAHVLAGNWPINDEHFAMEDYLAQGGLMGSFFDHIYVLTLRGILIAEVKKKYGNKHDKEFYDWYLNTSIRNSMQSLNSEVSKKRKNIAENKAREFTFNIVNVMKETNRLYLIGSKEYKKAAKALLFSQSFEEITYHLSNIAPNDHADAQVLTENLDDKEFIEKAGAIVWRALHYKIPISNLDYLLKKLEEIKRKLTKGNKEDAKILDQIETTLNYHRENVDRWINPKISSGE